MSKRKFKIGDTVEVFGYPGKQAKITEFVEDIEGGVRLDQNIGGFRFWNVIDLDLIEAAPKK